MPNCFIFENGFIIKILFRSIPKYLYAIASVYLATISKKIIGLQNLKILNLNDNFISYIPPFLKELKAPSGSIIIGPFGKVLLF